MTSPHRPFDPQQLNKYVMGEDYVNFLDTLFTTLEKDPLFNDGLTWHDYETMDINDHRLLQVCLPLAESSIHTNYIVKNQRISARMQMHFSTMAHSLINELT